MLRLGSEDELQLVVSPIKTLSYPDRARFRQAFVGPTPANDLFLKIQHSLANSQTGAELERLEGLAHIIVGTRLHRYDQTLPLGFGCKNQDEYIAGGMVAGANTAADLDACHARHHSIQDDHLRPAFDL